MAQRAGGGSTTHSADVPPAARGVTPPTQLSCVEVLEDSFAIVRTDRSAGGFTVYKVTYKAKTTSGDGVPIIQEFVVWKRFSDFQHLSKQLEVEHSLSKSRVKFPSLVKAKYFERFKEAVIEERRRSAEALLQFTTNFYHLVLSPPLQQFIAGSRPTKRTYPADPTTTGDASSVEPTPSPTFDSNTLTYTHTIDVSEEEQLAVGSTLANTKLQSETKRNGGEALDASRKTDKVDGETVSEMSVSPLPTDRTATESGSGDLLTVPDVEGTNLSSGASSKSGSNVSLENVELEADISELESTNLTGESVNVTEWNVAHSLKLRDGEKVAEKNEGEEEESESSEESGSPDENLEVEVVDSNSGVLSDKDGGEKEEDKTAGGNGGGGGMSWWADAMAESQNEIENLDALVEDCKDGDNSKTKNTSTSEQSLSRQLQEIQPSNGSVDKTASESKFDERKKLGRMSGRSSTDSINSIGKNKSTGSRRGSRQSSRSPSPSQRRSSPSVKDKAAYVIQAGRLISQALEFEGKEEYEEAFDLFKAGVDVLLNGVQTDSNKKRRELVRKKTSEYLKHAEDLYQKHLLTMSSSPTQPSSIPPTTQEPSVKAQPSTNKPVPHNLPDFKVVGLIGKVMLVESRHTGQKYIFKVLHKSLQAMSAAGKGVSKATVNRSPKQCPHMVRLLHHYPTPNHRIFLLLDYQKRGKLIDFVTAKREQWRKLRESASNPPMTSNLLVSNDGSSEKLTEDRESANKEDTQKEANNESKEEEEEAGLDDQEMERMLNELTSIVPPSNSLPVTSSLTSQEGTGGVGSDEDSLDSLALMRKRLEETVESQFDAEDDDNVLNSLSRDHPAASKEKDEFVRPTGSQSSGASITIEPPTPTDVAQNPLADDSELSKRTADKEKLKVTIDKETSSDSLSESLEASLPSTDIAPPKHSQSIDVPQRRSSKDVTEGTAMVSGGSPGRSSSKQGSPCFSPASMHNSPNVSNKVDDWMLRLEDEVRQWSAQIILALEHLHNHGILCRDLNCENILLTDSGSAVLTYFGKWDFVEQQTKHRLVKNLYVAPELQGLTEATIAADWWSLGAILFEILTGKSLISCHPCGVHTHLPLRVPVTLSPEAQSLLTQLLQVNPNERLGSGMDGVEEIKAHPFFVSIDWSSL